MGRYLDLIDAALEAEEAPVSEIRIYEKNEFNEISPLPGSELQEDEADPEGFEGRAAIIAEGSGAPVEWAEGYARLCTMPRPVHVRRERWLCCLDDAGRFLDQWAHKAATLGWEILDVFGVHPSKPEVRFDAAGLVWLLSGGSVIAMTESQAEIRLPSGARQRYSRRQHPTEAIAVWELEIEP